MDAQNQNDTPPSLPKADSCADPIALVEVLKQEFNSITGKDVDSQFPAWMLSLSGDKDFLLLQPDHLINAASFCQALSEAQPDSAYKILRDKLPGALQSLIASANPITPETTASLVWELNRLLKQDQLLFPETFLVSEKVAPQVIDLIRHNQSTGRWLAMNRLLLDTLLPSDIVKISNTVPGIYAWMHAQRRTALCFSGGGIRSATFGLGVTQGLAQFGLLNEFDYLSTVSGGGYLGSWLSAWIAREASAPKVFTALANENDGSPLNPEPEQVRHLREFSNYLTPKLGLLSADTWTLIATYLRNLLLNWIIFIPALATLLLVPRAYVSILRLKMSFPSLCALGAVGALSGIWGIVFAALHRPSVWKRRKNKNTTAPNAGTQGRFLWFCFTPILLTAFCFTTLWVWIENSVDGPRFLNYLGVSEGGQLTWKEFLIAGAAFHFVAWCCYAWRLQRGRFAEMLGVVSTGAFGGMLLWLGAHVTSAGLNKAPQLEWYVCLAVPYFLLAFLITATVFIGLTSRITTNSDREWWARMGGWLLIGGLGWSAFCILVLFGPECLWNIPAIFASLGGLSSLATLWLGYSGSTSADKKSDGQPQGKSMAANIGLAVAAPLFIICLVATISLCTTRLFKTMEPEKAFAGAEKFQASDIQDLPLFAQSLTQHTNAVSLYVWQHLSPAVQQKLQDPDNLKDKSPLPPLLADSLNVMIQTNTLYQPARFTNVTLSAQSASLTTVNWRGQRLMRFNRLLLQDAFPEALANDQFNHRMITHQTPLANVCIVFVCFGAVAWLLSRFININRFSLYAVYRNRLIRAYLGASNPKRNPNPFSGFDSHDDLCMYELYPRPFHIVNMALNLVTDSNLAWQQRKAESFTASRLHAGNYRLGYRNSHQYASQNFHMGFLSGSTVVPCDDGETQTNVAAPAGAADNERRGLTLGSAIAISGAAASPNCGYHSSPIVAALMTLFNVRLGAWLGNPGKAGNKTFTHRAPQSAVWHVVKEALGLTDDAAKYVYLSDGGHFENLALYEMILRRVHFIVVSDAGCDPDCALEDLGNAIRKIRIDLGVPIEIDQFNIGSRSNKPESKYCAIGHIDYARVDGPGTEPGILIYIKPAIAGNEPRDVYNYAETSVLFPHEPTSDQWFTESQFESYRMLGMHIVQTMCAGANDDWKKAHHLNPLHHFKNQAANYLKDPAPAAPKEAPEKTQSSKPETPTLK